MRNPGYRTRKREERAALKTLDYVVEALEDRRLLTSAIGINSGSTGELEAVAPSPAEMMVNNVAEGPQRISATARSVASNAAGDTVVVFSGAGPDDSRGVFARRYDATNTPIGNPYLVNVTTAGNQAFPSVALGAGGESVVVWSGRGAGDDNSGVFARLYDNTGAALSGEIKVSQTTTGKQQKPVVAKAEDGSFVVTWSGRGVGDRSGVFARRYASNGIPLTGEFLVNTTTTGKQHQPDLAIASDGSFVITWSGRGADDTRGVYFQRYNTSGLPMGTEARANTTFRGKQVLPSVGIDGANNFMIVWSGNGLGDSRGVFLQRFNASGSPVSGEELVNDTTAYRQGDASLSVAPSGSAVVTWSSESQDGSRWGVFVQEYSAAGAKVGDEVLVNTTTHLNQEFSSVAVQGETSYNVVWSGRGQGDTNGVFLAGRLRQPVP